VTRDGLDEVHGTPIEDPRVTVVVMSRDRRDELIRTLGRHRAPVILVDNASTDGTIPAVRHRFPSIDVIGLPRNAGAFARTLGVRRSTTEFVAFADDDSWWAPGALTAAANILAADPGIAVVNGRILVGPDHRLDEACETMAGSPLPRPSGDPYPSLLGFVACGAMVRRSAFDAVGGFDDVIRFPGEEERVALDLVAGRWRIVYADQVVVHHHPSVHRHAPEARVAAITRAAVLTALLRLTWPRVARRAWTAARDSSATRSGLLRAARDAPRALRHRRPCHEEVQRDLDLLRQAAARRVLLTAGWRRSVSGGS
jgi:GT2 family glycosyltransferase